MENLQAVLALSMRLLFRSKKTIFMGLLTLLPVAIALLITALLQIRPPEGVQSGFGQISQFMTVIYLNFLLLAVTLFYATSLIGDEIEEKTITYLFVRPVRRSTIYLGKFLACLTLTASLLLPSALLSFLILMTADPSGELLPHLGIVAQDVAVLALGIFAYCALFGAMGVFLKRPLLVGLGFCLLWESLVTYIPGYIHRFTVMHYLHSLVPHPVGQRGMLQIFSDTTPAFTSIVTLLLVGGGFLAFGCWLIGRKQYVLEA